MAMLQEPYVGYKNIPVGVRSTAWPLDALEVTADRLLVVIRLPLIVVTIFLVALWWPWYLDTPTRCVAPAVIFLWNITFFVVNRNGRASPWISLVDVILGVMLAATARDWLPAELVGEPATWLFLHVMIMISTAIWSLRKSWWIWVPLGGETAFVAGSGGADPILIVTGTALLGISLLVGDSRRQLRRIAQDSGSWLQIARSQLHADKVAAVIARRQREQERLIHDTVLNTLTGIAWGGGDDVGQARRRCHESVEAMRKFLDDEVDGTVDLIDRVEQVVAEANATGLSVTLLKKSSLPRSEGEIPTDVCNSLAAALREVLANVRRHAGTNSACVTFTHDFENGVRIEAYDQGRGFDPKKLDPDRLGIRRSVIERIRDIGGSAEIRSAPGHGTHVVLLWRDLPPLRPEQPQRAVAGIPVMAAVEAALCASLGLITVAVVQGSITPRLLSNLGTSIFAIWTVLILVTSTRSCVTSSVTEAARAVTAEVEMEARHQAANEVEGGKRWQRQYLEQETLPLLWAISAGGADPTSDVVRRACARQAARIRRRLTASTQWGDLDLLEAAVISAEDRGVAVRIQSAGSLAQVPAPILAEVLETVGSTLNEITSGEALLTILCSDDGGNVYLVFPADKNVTAASRKSSQGRSSGWTNMTTEIDGDQAFLEVGWSINDACPAP